MWISITESDTFLWDCMRSLCLVFPALDSTQHSPRLQEEGRVQTEKQRDIKVGLLLGAKTCFVVTVISCVSLSALVRHCREAPSAVLGLPNVHLLGLGLISMMAFKCCFFLSFSFLFFFPPLFSPSICNLTFLGFWIFFSCSVFYF